MICLSLEFLVPCIVNMWPFTIIIIIIIIIIITIILIIIIICA